MLVTTARDIPTTLAPLLQLLELEKPRVVTRMELERWAQASGVTWPVEVVIRRLRERGWLLNLVTRGVWEFASATRAGAFGSGDPLIELRATLARDPSVPFAVAAESAAYFLGLATRRPDWEVVGGPEGVRPPTALSGFRLVRWEPATTAVIRDGLPVWSIATLLAFMAARPAGYRDWPNVGEWIAEAVREVSLQALERELQDRSRAGWARAAYLLSHGGRADLSVQLLSLAPLGAGPYYLGDRRLPGRYDRVSDVIDSTGMEVDIR